MTYTQPLIVFFGLLALLGVMRTRGPRRLALAGVLGLLLAAWPPLDWLLSRPLEARYPLRTFEPPPGVEAVVVLSGEVQPAHGPRPYALAGPDTYNRCALAAWIHRRRPGLPVLACGGPGAEGQPPFAATMREVLASAGVPAAMIWTEERSRSTHENAVFGAQILRRHGIGTIALVVDAQSMPRAAACFRKEGFTVAPAPSSFRQFGSPREELIPGWRAIERNEITLHEVLGLAWYRLRGWI